MSLFLYNDKNIIDLHELDTTHIDTKTGVASLNPNNKCTWAVIIDTTRKHHFHAEYNEILLDLSPSILYFLMKCCKFADFQT